MTWDEMVEIAARARHEDEGAHSARGLSPWESQPENVRRHRRAEIDAALRALRAAGVAMVPRETDDSLMRLLARADASLTDVARARTAWNAALSAGQIKPEGE